jgi:WD40 repeat protein
MISRYSSKVTLYDFDSGALKSHSVSGYTFNKLKWSPDGAYLAVTSRRSRTVHIFEVSTWENQVFDFEHHVSVKRIY